MFIIMQAGNAQKIEEYVPVNRLIRYTLRPLARMIAGMTLVALSFVVCAILQGAMEGRFDAWEEGVRGNLTELTEWTLKHNKTVVKDGVKSVSEYTLYTTFQRFYSPDKSDHI